MADEEKEDGIFFDEIGNLAGKAVEGAETNRWVERGGDKIAEGGGYMWEGVKRLNPLGVLGGIGNMLAGAATFDGKQFTDGVQGIANPVVGAAELAIGGVETAIGGVQATTGGIAKGAAKGAYAIGDAAGNLVKSDPEEAVFSDKPVAVSSPAKFTPAAQTFPLEPDETRLEQRAGLTTDPGPKSNPVFSFRNETRKKEAEAALKDIGDLSDGFSVSKLNKVLKNMGAEEIGKNSSFGDLMVAEGIIKMNLAGSTVETNSSPSHVSSGKGASEKNR